MFRISAISKLLVVGTVVLTAGTAFGQFNYVVRAGSECQDGHTIVDHFVVRTSLGAMRNNDNVSVNAVCPLAPPNNSNEPVVRVDYLDNASPGYISCRVECYDFDGVSANFSSTELSSGVGYGFVTIDDVDYEDGRCNLLCTLPATDTDGASELISYVESYY